MQYFTHKILKKQGLAPSAKKRPKSSGFTFIEIIISIALISVVSIGAVSAILLAREIADNPYLMTPYRALRLAVINKERIFEILSTLAANQDDDVIRRHAELLAQGQLSEIAQLRLHRRRASRSEIKTAIDRAGLDAPPVEMDNFNRSVQTVHAIVRAMTLVVRDSWTSEMTGETERILQGLLEESRDFPDRLVVDEDRASLEARVRQANDSLFSALKALLRELESAVDLFLGYAESARSEDVAHAAQTKAERYVHLIAKIRDELPPIIHDGHRV